MEKLREPKVHCNKMLMFPRRNILCSRPRCCTVHKVVLGRKQTWTNEMNSGMKHAPGAGSIARPVDLQSAIKTATNPPIF